MKTTLPIAVLAAVASLSVPFSGQAACCYFAAKDKDVLQPGQKAFITYDAEEKIETFTVQPKFEGNASDFGMVIPTPTRPKLDEMPREFFKHLAVFTILEPMDMSKYKQWRTRRAVLNSAVPVPKTAKSKKLAVRVLEAGIVGSLDYKIISAERADDLFEWLALHEYSYGGDEKTLQHYITKGWMFTVMKIDPKQLKRKADGSYTGDITPTRFTFSSDKIIYPLRITQISVKDKTEALFYVQTSHKVDLPGTASYNYTWQPMWAQATGFAIPEKLTEQEKKWKEFTAGKIAGTRKQLQNLRRDGKQAATLEWAKKITAKDLDIITGVVPYNRDAPADDVKKLRNLRGHVQKDKFITKMRKVFTKGEMGEDLVFARARYEGEEDDIEYFSILPTSPP